jgi:hypothetical protein
MRRQHHSPVGNPCLQTATSFNRPWKDPTSSQNSPTVRANILHFEGRDRIKEVLGYVEQIL